MSKSSALTRSLLSEASLFLLACSLTTLLAGCGPGRSHDGAADHTHDEGAEHSHGADHSHGGGIAVTAWTDASELFFEYPALTAGEKSEPWAVHLTRLSDFSPITEGKLVAEFRAPAGTVYTVEAAAPVRPGIYAIAPTLPAAGSYDLVMVIEGPQLADRIAAGSVDVHPPDAQPAPPPEPPDGISFLKEQQWVIEFAVARAEVGEVPVGVEAVGEIVPAADRSVAVAAPVGGLALAAGNLRAPAFGERVEAGQTLVALSPTLQESSYAIAKERVERLELEVGRLSRLFEAEAVAEKRLLEARHELEIAQATMQALGNPEGDGWDYPVRAPISGLVQARHFTPGQRVDAGETLYEIVDPRSVWLRLRVPARHAASASGASGAIFTVEGSDRVYESGRLVSVGAAIDSASRTLPVILAVDNRDRSLKIGLFVSATLTIGDSVSGVVVPNSAIQRDDGQPVAYVQAAGETFQRRPLVLGPTDGTRTLVENGVSEGEHVVTRGAYDVYLASLKTSEIGDHGHPH